MKTFSCDFGGGVSCELAVSETPPSKGSSHILDLRWTGVPQKRHIHPYLRWVKTVNQQLADEWQVRLLHVLQTKRRRWQTWAYEPGGKPLLLKEVKI